MKKSPMPPQDPRYHNTKALLQNYRDTIWSLEVSAEQLRGEYFTTYGSSIEECLSAVVPLGNQKEEHRLERYQETLEKSRRMIDLLNAAVQILRDKHKKGDLYYWVLYCSYLSPKEPDNCNKVLDLLDQQGFPMSLRCYYLRRDEAIRLLSSVLWGCDDPPPSEVCLSGGFIS